MSGHSVRCSHRCSRGSSCSTSEVRTPERTGSADIAAHHDASAAVRHQAWQDRGVTSQQPAPKQYPAPHAPARLFPDDVREQRWRARFLAPRVSVPSWSLDAPDANIYVSNASGVWEIYAWDRATGESRQVTDRPNGTLHATTSPDGAWIWWFDDTDGDEFGSWVRQPFDASAAAGAPREEAARAERALADVPDGYPAGLEIGHRLVAVGVSTDEGSSLYAQAGGTTTRFYTHSDDAGVSALSRDEQLLAI